jgi:hypothetical protein
MGTNGVVNQDSGEYGAGVGRALVVSVSAGAAHLGRNAVLQTGRTGGIGLGVRRLFSDPRKWGSAPI